ncbi:DUF4179 domain-containing protein [Radiobacillus deserti]|uniref:DUF4179 domain-containing protein n=1 Tax=Radiobacillus deserti TaxID=2594883 RepID=A0A516KL15_9BACI|nr:DUF4179 domain-containing protein [Radiobacillus deserti]QDP42080.1 DUF4179 domain-containing protein [Radiobacillus deserti]
MNCRKCQVQLPKYMNGKLSPEKKEKLEAHLHTCPTCMNIYERLKNKPVKKKIEWTPKKLGIIAGSVVFLVFLLAVTGAFGKVSAWWSGFQVSDNQSLEDIKQFGVGNSVNLKAESNGIEMRITHVVADDIQTYIYYEVEDLEKERKWAISGRTPLYIDAERGVLDYTKALSGNYMISNVQNRNKSEDSSVFKGRIGIVPLQEDKTESDIKLKIKQLVEISTLPIEEEMRYGIYNMEGGKTVQGEWSFTVPVEKQEIKEEEINQDVTIAGHDIHVTKLTVAPTTTLLHYEYEIPEPDEQSNYMMNSKFFDFEYLKSGNEVYEPEHTSLTLNNQGSSSTRDLVIEEIPFQSMYFSPPNQLEAKVRMIQETIAVNETFSLDPYSKEPQTFPFQGSTISVENIKLGAPTTLIVRTPYTKERNFEDIFYDIHTKPESVSIEVEGTESFIIDQDGNTYTGTEPIPEGVSARFFPTEQRMTLESGKDEEPVPISLQIHSYTKTTYPSESIHIEW